MEDVNRWAACLAADRLAEATARDFLVVAVLVQMGLTEECLEVQEAREGPMGLGAAGNPAFGHNSVSCHAGWKCLDVV